MDVVKATLWLLFTTTTSVSGTSVVDFRSPTTNYSPGPVQEGWRHSWDLREVVHCQMSCPPQHLEGTLTFSVLLSWNLSGKAVLVYLTSQLGSS